MKHNGVVNGAVLTKDETGILSWSENGTPAPMGRRCRPADRAGHET